MVKAKKNGHARLFRSSFLEALTRTNPLLHVVTYGSIVLLFFSMNDLTLAYTLLSVISGIIGWTLTEYLVHRFLFHMTESKFQYLIHGVHHEFPKDQERLMMPPIPGILILSIITITWSIILGKYLFAFMAGFTMGYLLYTFIHFLIHARKPIRGFKFIWAHHLKHHSPKFENAAFGVSSPIWDWIFRTMPEKEIDY